MASSGGMFGPPWVANVRTISAHSSYPPTSQARSPRNVVQLCRRDTDVTVEHITCVRLRFCRARPDDECQLLLLRWWRARRSSESLWRAKVLPPNEWATDYESCQKYQLVGEEKAVQA